MHSSLPYLGGGSPWTETPPGQRPPGQRPLDRDPIDRDPPLQRPPRQEVTSYIDPRRQTNVSEDITLPQTSFAGGKYKVLKHFSNLS